MNSKVFRNIQTKQSSTVPIKSCSDHNRLQFRKRIVLVLMESLEEPRPKIVQHSFQPIYYFSRCVGLWPFTITYNANGSIKGARVQKFDIFWCSISICLYLASQYHYIDRRIINTHTTKKSYLSNLIYFTSQMTFLSFGSVAIILDMYNRKSLVNILDKLSIFDSKVKSLCVIEK